MSLFFGIVGIIALILTIYLGIIAPSKKDTNKILKNQESLGKKITELKKNLQTFRDGIAEHVSKDEPIRAKVEKADSSFRKGKYKESFRLYAKVSNLPSSQKNKLLGLLLMGKGMINY